MARTHAGGPSFNEDELADPTPPDLVREHQVIRRMNVGDESFPGDSSEQSGLSERRSSDGVNRDPRLPAQTTGNRSGEPQGVQTPSIVPSTGGDGPETEQPPSDEVPPYDEWSNAELKEECRKRGLPVGGNHDALVERLDTDDYRDAAEQELQ
jgi:SAP domain